jgi:succinoglycan biosynthesis transport protein ExoP
MFLSNDFEVRDLGPVLARRRGIILVFLLVFLALSIALNVVTPPAYRTAARLAILPVASRSPVTGAALESVSPASENLSLLTTAERIMSRDVLERVARELRNRGIVMGHPAKLAVADAGSPGVANAATSPSDAPTTPDSQLVADVDWLAKNVFVRPIRDTRLVDVVVEHSDARAAAEIANSVARVFVKTQIDSRREADSDRLAALRQQISDLRASIQESERRLYGSRSSTLVLADERNRRLAQAGTEMNTAAIRARADLRVVDAQLALIAAFRRAAAPDWSSPPVQTEGMDDLHRQLQAADSRVGEMRRQYRDQSQEVIAAEAQAASVRDAMRRELQKAASDLEGQRDILIARAEGFEDAMDRNERSLKAINDSSYKYSTVESELRSKKDLYQVLIQKAQEQDVATAIQPSNVEIVQGAAIPLDRVRPRKALNIGLGIALGLVFGGGTAFTLEALRRTIRTPQDVMHELRLPVLGMIPRRNG